MISTARNRVQACDPVTGKQRCEDVLNAVRFVRWEDDQQLFVYPAGRNKCIAARVVGPWIFMGLYDRVFVEKATQLVCPQQGGVRAWPDVPDVVQGIVRLAFESASELNNG